MDGLWAALFVVSSFFNGRAAFKLLLDWKGMLTTCRFVEDAYEQVETLPDEAALARDSRAPVFLHLVPAYQEPAIGAPLRALLASPYPASNLPLAGITKEVEGRRPPGPPRPRWLTPTASTCAGGCARSSNRRSSSGCRSPD